MQSRADEFDRMELLIFLENDHSGDTPRMTETNKELFRRKLEVKSVPFDSMNQVNVEARQAYSSGLAGGWLSHLPIELEEEGELRLEPLSNMHRSPSFRRLLDTLDQVYSGVGEKDKDLNYSSFYEELCTLQRMQQVVAMGLSLQRLSQGQKSKLRTFGRDVDDLSMDITSGRFRTKGAQKEMDIIWPWILSLSSQFGVLIASASGKGGAVESGEDLKHSGQSGMKSIPANLIAPGLSASDFEGERPADNQMTPTSIPTSSKVTSPTENLTVSTPQETLPNYQRTSTSNRWLPKVFNQRLQISPTMLEESADPGPSELFGEHVPDAIANLDNNGYVGLAEFRFRMINSLCDYMTRRTVTAPESFAARNGPHVIEKTLGSP